MIPLRIAILLFVLVISLSLLSSPILAYSKAVSKSNTSLKHIKGVQIPLEDKSVKITKITQSRFLQVLYVVTIEICAGMDKLYSPELILKSDKESLTLKISGLIMPKACRTNEFFIRADNPYSISVSFSNVNPHLEKIPH
ncbi:hypothetical protein DSQ19_04435 [Candidatus Nitrosotenuis sp. DW1]|nr:hypothetical protein DSQ19_04435 [Candidatus Nitrosotenuis sp. DW1]